jgi:hypothetical protein
MSTFRIILDDLGSNWKTLVMLGVVKDIDRRRVVGMPRVGDRCFTSILLETYVEDG